MKTQIKQFTPKLFILVVLIIASLLLAACTSATSEGAPETAEDQQNESSIPVVGSVDGEEVETGEDKSYPDIAQETQSPEIAESPLGEAYPESEMETHAQADADSPQGEAYPAPQEDPIQEPKPTPRGSELVATNPSTVNLGSGQLQLVELFAFW